VQEHRRNRIAQQPCQEITVKQTSTDRPSVYQIVTDRIIASLKEGTIPWEKPWKAPTFAGGNFPRNFVTGKAYRGVNVFLLWGTRFSSPFWLTFKQAIELGGNVRKGEKGSQIVFYKQLRTRKVKADDAPLSKEGSKEDERAPFILTYYTVFNVEQCEGLTIPTVEATPALQIDADDICESIVSGWAGRPSIRTEEVNEGRAYYRPATDSVHLPARFRFIDTAHYYATLFHELVHSTGHESRLARTFGSSFGDELYSKEELVAETGAAFLCAIAGIGTKHTEQNTAAYIQNWISKLEQDNRLIVQAAASAQRAVDLITGHSFEGQNSEEGEGSADANAAPSSQQSDILAA
jgi:antirestriction protein ArdC